MKKHFFVLVTCHFSKKPFLAVFPDLVQIFLYIIWALIHFLMQAYIYNDDTQVVAMLPMLGDELHALPFEI